MAKNPVSILYDGSGNPVEVLNDGGVYRLRTDTKLTAGHGLATEATAATLATETKLEAVRALLATIDAKDFATQTTLAALLTELQLKADLSETQPVSAASLPLPAGAATEAKLEAVRALLATIDADTSSIAAEDFATETTQATLATEAKLEAVRVLLASLDAKDYATQTTLAQILVDTGQIETLLGTIDADTSTLAAVDYATQTTLAAILVDTGQIEALLTTIDADTGSILTTQTDGTQKSRLLDHNGNSLSVQDGVVIPAGNDHLLVGGLHETDTKTYHARMRDDPTTAAVKRVMVEAAIAPGATIQVTAGNSSSTGAVSNYLENGSSHDMVVDGSVTPVVFAFDADATNDIQLTSMRLVFSAAFFNFDGSTFGKGGGALPNGVSIDITANDGAFTAQLLDFMVNEDFLRLLDFSVSQAGSTDVLAASLPFGGNILLEAGTSDKITVTINDALDAGVRGISYFTSTIYGVELI